MIEPEVGKRYTGDQITRRELEVQEVEIGEPLGREIRGRVREYGQQDWQLYTCSLEVFNANWTGRTKQAKEFHPHVS